MALTPGWSLVAQVVGEWKAAGALAAFGELRQSKYLNNLIEQDHRFLKRLVKPGWGFFSVETARKTFQGYEGMNRMRKGQVQGVKRGDSLRQATFIAERFGVVISTQRRRGKPRSLYSSSDFCNRARLGTSSERALSLVVRRE